MKRLALALLLSSFAIGGAVADPTCHDRAAEKKLAGAALTSFMKGPGLFSHNPPSPARLLVAAQRLVSS